MKILAGIAIAGLLCFMAVGVFVVGVLVVSSNSTEELALNHTRVLSCTFDQDRLVYDTVAEVEYTRPMDDSWGANVNVDVNFLDSEGRVFSSDTVRFENIQPGQTALGRATTARDPSVPGDISCAVVGGG